MSREEDSWESWRGSSGAPEMVGEDAVSVVIVGPSPTKEELGAVNGQIAAINREGYRLREVTAAGYGLNTVMLVFRYSREGS